MNKLLILNHKTIMTYDDVAEYIANIRNCIRKDIDVVICPNNVFIPYFKGRYDFYLGSQNISAMDITGETNAHQLKSLDVRYSIIGHSDRLLLNETSNMINRNIKDALDNNIIPIVCIGETKEERARKKTGEVLSKKLKEYFNNIDVKEDIIIAYEPIWAIGSGLTPEKDDIKEVIEYIKNAILKKYNINIRVIYGGSVSLSNIDKLNTIKELDGYMIGKISTDSKNMLEIMNRM